MDSHKTGVENLPRVELTKRFFTVDQANRAVVLVSRIVGDVLVQYRLVLDNQELLEAFQAKGDPRRSGGMKTRIMNGIEQLQAYADELIDVGVELKDWAAGIVDFPAMHDGREIHLCWRHGEPSVQYWHEIDDGCGGRQDIDW